MTNEFAHSTFGVALCPSTCKLWATRTSVRDASPNVALTFGGTNTTHVPEP